MVQDDARDSVPRRGNGRGTWEDDHRNDGPSLGELLKRISGDMGTLVSQEVHLARTELRDSAATAAKGTAKLGVAMTVANAGAIALTAFLVIAIGDAIDNYWIAALVIGAAELILGVMLAKSAINSMKSPDMKPRETIDSLREDKAWAQREARDLKRDMSSASTVTNSR